jgi:hypothetical protein
MSLGEDVEELLLFCFAALQQIALLVLYLLDILEQIQVLFSHAIYKYI